MARKRSGQAAMEFLMTYGWAILAVGVVIGILIVYGPNPQKLIPASCNIGTGLACSAFKLSSTGQFDIKITNSMGSTVSIDSITLDDTNAGSLLGTCVSPAPPAVGPLATVVSGDNTPALSVTCAPATPLSAGGRVKAKLIVVYTDKTSGFNHTQIGSLVADVE